MADAVRGALPPSAYVSHEWFGAERERVFGQSWLCVGLASELAGDGDYLTNDAGPRSLVVRRFADGLRAFRNVCSHRGARILDGPCGSGPLQCRYHGWTYDAAGRPVGLPGNRDDFGLSAAERDELALPSFPVATVGPLVFVGAPGSHTGVEEFLGPFHATIARLGRTFAAPPVFHLSEEWNAGWKLGVENTLEPLHAEFVHGESLAQVVERQFEIEIAGRHSAIFHRLQEGSRRWWDRMAPAAGLDPDPDLTEYRHWFVFPNLCLGLTNGSLLSVQLFEPVAPARFRLRQWLLLAAADQAGGAMRRTLQDFLIGFNRQVLDEDRVPVESAQRGIGELTGPVLLAKSEARVAAFQQAVFDQVRGLESVLEIDHSRGDRHA